MNSLWVILAKLHSYLIMAFTWKCYIIYFLDFVIMMIIVGGPYVCIMLGLDFVSNYGEKLRMDAELTVYISLNAAVIALTSALLFLTRLLRSWVIIFIINHKTTHTIEKNEYENVPQWYYCFILMEYWSFPVVWHLPRAIRQSYLAKTNAQNGAFTSCRLPRKGYLPEKFIQEWINSKTFFYHHLF